MLAEHFVASIAAPTKPNTGVTKDSGIFLHEYQPLTAQRHVFKKSASAPNGLAVSSSHIFSAQADKATVHVYSREKGNQEAIVPFPERIHSIALASNDTVLLLGTESGRVLVWEICSGRLVSTSTSHLQPVTSIAVDPTSNFFLSGSPDAMVQVWNLAAILSFSPDASRSPVHTLSTHRGPIAGLAVGHSSSTANIAISISQDKSALVWDYHSGQALRTYLLPETPTAVALDPADRAFYVAYEDGSLQTISFYDDMQQTTAVDILRDGSQSHQPVQPSEKTRFNADSQKLGAARSVGLSWDGTNVISGHESGKIVVWDVAKGNYVSTLVNLPGSVTNLKFLAPTGFQSTSEEQKFKIHTIVKPKQDAGLSANSSGLVPSNYSLTMQFTGRLAVPSISATDIKGAKTEFEVALTHPSFPVSMLEESLAELDAWTPPAKPSAAAAPAGDFISLAAVDTDGPAKGTSVIQGNGKDDEIKELKKQLASLQRIQTVTFKQLSEVREEKDFLLQKEKKRAQQKQEQAKKKLGAANGDVEMSEGASSEDGSSASESNDSDAAASSSGEEESEEEEESSDEEGEDEAASG